jgi:hypothetical protein
MKDLNKLHRVSFYFVRIMIKFSLVNESHLESNQSVENKDIAFLHVASQEYRNHILAGIFSRNTLTQHF